MFFTQEELKPFFFDTNNDQPYGHSPESRENYALIRSYLLGERPDLSGLHPTYEYYQLLGLAYLLGSPAAPTAHTTRLLDLFFHPDVLPGVTHYLPAVFGHLALQAADVPAVHAWVSLMHRLGLSDTDIFMLLLNQLNRGAEGGDFLATDPPVKQWMQRHLPPAGRVQRSAHSWGDDQWSYPYFVVVEAGRPADALQELFVGLSLASEWTSDLLRHADGHYLPQITAWIRGEHGHLHEVVPRFYTAAELYEWKGEEVAELLLHSARLYLSWYRQRSKAEYHEPYFSGKKLNGYYSTVALSRIFNDAPGEAVKLLEEWFRDGVPVSLAIHTYLKKAHPAEALPFLREGLLGKGQPTHIEHSRGLLEFLQQGYPQADYLDTVWKLAATKSKPLRTLVADMVLKRDPDAEQKAIALLKSKSSEARQTGAIILSAFSSDSARAAVGTLLDAEANDNARDLFLQIAQDGFPPAADTDFLERTIAAARGRGKLDKPVESWLDEATLPPLYDQSGAALPPDTVRFLLYRMRRVKAMEADPEARFVLAQVDKERSGPFAGELLRIFTDKQGKPEYKYLLALAALVGNEAITDKVCTLINEWIDSNRGKMAEYGIGALALQGSDKALRIVEAYSRKFQNKKQNIGAAALQALEDAASALGITVHELGDRVLPDLGFEGVYKEFSVGDAGYRAFIDSNFKLVYYDEDNKKLKALPAAAGPEIKAYFKDVAKEVRDVVKAQSGRMEYFLVVQRRWTPEAWQALFLGNPIMFIYATKLLWGLFDEAGALRQCFLCLDDGSLVDEGQEELELPEGSFVGMVHPLQLEPAALDRWKRQFFDAGIAPVFPQLDRAAHAPADPGRRIVTDYAGRPAEQGAVLGTLERAGWRKGPSGDGGFLDHFSFREPAHGIEAILQVEGVFAGGFGYDYEPKLGRLYFLKDNGPRKGWFRPPADESDERLLLLADVPPIFYSEVIASVERVRTGKAAAATP
ncbi:DUF4132 domain-containing protein [Flaviaesturariibacter amylovorans]|uniref:DUF4132 domain-containing protein n=1 Tax=Flaviaesturariibacter amylovorans TaxID=1084520 RepID=A0ABP8GZI1_9BACT